MSELLWVAVPNGLVPSAGTPTKATLRVLVVPRLTGIDIAEDGLQDWPSLLLDQASFELRTKTSEGVDVARHTPTLVSVPRPEVWSKFFQGEAAQVNPFVPKTQPVPKVRESYSEARDAAATYRRVTRVGANPANATNDAVKAELGSWENKPGLPTPTAPVGSPVRPIADFHATVSKLREHPTVLLDLGLVFDLTVDVSDLTIGNPADRQLSIVCDGPPSLEALVTSPWTRYALNVTDVNRGFWPAPTPGSESGHSQGILRLDQAVSVTSPAAPAPDATKWAVATFDVDGAVNNLRQTAQDVAANRGQDVAMPPTRSAGLVLIRPQLEADLAQRVESAGLKARTAMAETAFGAEDLVLGYRVDILRDGGDWCSLCEREVDYTVGEDRLPIGSRETNGLLREEGHVKPMTATKDAAGGLHTDEVVMRWDGWSLAVPTIDLRGDTDGLTRNEGVPLPYKFDFDFHTRPGRLPALRFSSSYRMRIRLADIAGGGRELESVAGSAGASPDIRYLRHDPLPPPQLPEAGPFAAGSAVDRLVIRSDDDDPGQPGVEVRKLSPPIASLQLIEQHGMLDDESRTEEQTFDLALRAMRADDGPGLPDPAAKGVRALIRKPPDGPAGDLDDRDDWPSWPGQNPTKTIRLRSHTAPDVAVTMAWVGSTLEVTLGKGQNATLELSSALGGNFIDHFALDEYLQAAPGEPVISNTDTAAGRNPIVSPPRKIDLLHVVKRPLAEPLWVLDPIRRRFGDTSIAVNATFPMANEGQRGMHPASTGLADVSAGWQEIEDVGDKAGSGDRPVVLEHLHTQKIARDLELPPPMRFLHDFGDTKHRDVVYTVTFTSRYREYWDAGGDETRFQRKSAQVAVNVPSTTRPPAPVVLGVVPAFRWQRPPAAGDRIERVREARRLRVELARPWYQTGAGEQLAVVLAPDDASPAAKTAFVSRLGRDPLFASQPTAPRPRRDWFDTNLSAPNFKLPELNADVALVPFDVTADDDRWYADVVLKPEMVSGFYNPLVTLAVARYQRDSISGMQLSPVVVTDCVPLLPDRRVVLTRNGSQVTVAVTGPGPTPLNSLEVILETCDPGIPPETLEAVLDAADPEVPGWRPVPGGTVTRSASGVIPPLTLANTPGPLRIRIREWEKYLNPDPGPRADLLTRNVFVDTIVVPAAWTTP